jgi:hypothetical protein
MSTPRRELPYWPDDPLIDRHEHRLNLYQDGAGCTCGEWTAPPTWDHHAVFEGYDIHMYDMQVRARET